jgi:hypothetical protein
MQIPKRRLVILPVAMLMCSITHAELPDLPKDSIKPLYGKWSDDQGRNPQTHVIGPQWLAESNAQCGYRYRYQILKMEPKIFGKKKSWDIELETLDQVLLGKKASAEGCSLVFPKKFYIYVGVGDVGDPANAPITTIEWEECDTAEHLRQFVEGNPTDHPGCDGSIASRL